jgi:hypothetical protein
VKILLTCRESVQLMVASEDRPLTGGERFALRMHLWMCTKCPKFLQQLKIIRRMLDRWKAEEG